MFPRRSLHATAEGARRLAKARARLLIPGLLVAAAASSTAAIAIASSSTPILRTASNEALRQTIVVDSRDRSLYVLSPETTHHLLCRHECLGLWPPLTVRSRSVKLRAASGIHGRLGLLRRSNGTLQVTLRGLPLYRYSGDTARGEANGVGIKSFGGTWHALSSSGARITTPPMPATPMPTTPTATTPAPAPPPYNY